MSQLLFELPLAAASRAADRAALRFKGTTVTYAALARDIDYFAAALLELRIDRQERVAVFLPKQPETVVTMFGAARAGCVFVPVNSVLKPAQVQHILRDCNVRVLVTSPERARDLAEVLAECPDLRHLIVVGDANAVTGMPNDLAVHAWSSLPHGAPQYHRVIDTDVVSIFYTSGSTGKPKGVVLSHKNMVTGAHSVASYLANTPDDRLLAALPFSFDYGFSQLSTAFHAGASVVLMDYIFARDVIALAARERATGLAGVPPLWLQLADLPWPDEVRDNLRYVTNSGGAMPVATLRKLRAALPKTTPFLMYGLTEAFRSTYLPPAEIDRRPESMGKAIPNAEILVVRPDGTPCAPNEPGELVHRGSLVSLGYWNDPGKTAERFKPAPGRDPALVLTEMAVWSGDTVRMDEDGFLYFVGRRDEMIKTSGYRVSPTEVEEAVYATGLVSDAVAVGVPHPTLGQAIALVASPAPGGAGDSKQLLDECRKRLALYMVPAIVEWREELPRNPNGKFDRPLLATQLREAASKGPS
jgi:acyl-CoA ligase (AMP-forming) (exosortase A-associated)